MKVFVFELMKTIELEGKIRNLKNGETIPLKGRGELNRAYSAATALRRAGVIDFGIYCPATGNDHWVAMRKPK